MIRRAWAAHVALLGVVLVCATDAASANCTGDPRCTPGGLGTLAAALLGVVLVVGLAVAALVRAVYRTGGALAAVSSLPSLPAAALGHAGAGLHLPRVTCVDADPPIALCAGLLRPRIFVSRGLVDALSIEELRAVLLHEASHARRRDPLRRAARRALADLLFFVPVVRWWADRRAVLDEVAADRSALAVCGPRALARALLASHAWNSDLVAAFGGAAAARVAHLLGEPIRLPRPTAGMWRASLAGGVAIGVILTCTATTLIRV